MTSAHTNDFVPLVAAAPSGSGQDFKITVIPRQEQPEPFQSLEKKAPATVHKRSCEPQLTVQRSGDRITNIRVECNCGQIIDLACVYEGQAKP